MKTSRFRDLCVVAACAGLLTGCSSTTVNTVEPAVPTARREMLADQRVQTDPSLAKAVRVVGVNTATDAAGFLKVQVEVQNTTRSRKQFTYRVQWFDPHGMIIDTPTAAATPRSLEGRETAYITTTAPTPQAKDFRILFLEPVTK
jgi:uncharacterized protein YcfL